MRASIVSIHSFRGGTGKSNTTANVVALLAASGRAHRPTKLGIRSRHELSGALPSSESELAPA